MRRLYLATRLLLLVALVAAVGAYAKAPAGQFMVKIPAPGHLEVVVLQAKAGTHFAKGAVPKPALLTPATLPSGVIMIADAGRLKKNHGLLDAGVVVINLNKKSASRHTADFNIATGLKWTPLRYTHPIGVSADDCSGDGTQISCAGTNPHQAALYGWQTTGLDNYAVSFLTGPAGIKLGLDLGYTSQASDYTGAAQGMIGMFFAPASGGFVVKRPGSATPLPIFSLFSMIDGFVTPAPNVSCTTGLTNQGTTNEVISTTTCKGGTFTGLLYTPLNGNRIVDQFPEQGQAKCSPSGSGGVYCWFNPATSSSGPIDLRFQGMPSGVQVQRSTDSGQTYQPGPWTSTGP